LNNLAILNTWEKLEPDHNCKYMNDLISEMAAAFPFSVSLSQMLAHTISVHKSG
jgi:hypothetical protein